MAEQLVGLLDVVELEAVRDHRAEVGNSSPSSSAAAFMTSSRVDATRTPGIE